MVSTSQAVAEWQPKFQLDSKPLPASANVRVWDKGEGGRVAQSLVNGLFLLEDIHIFEDGTDETLGRQLQWHTIAVISCPLVLFAVTYTFFSFSYIIIVLSGRVTNSRP